MGTTSCYHCGSKFDVRSSMRGAKMPCPVCGEKTQIPMKLDGDAPPRPRAAAATDNEHLRMIRAYVGWLLVLTAAPAVLTGIAAVLWLVRLVAG